jgi:hypothetical protein
MKSAIAAFGTLLAASCVFASPALAGSVRATTGGTGAYGVSQGDVFYDAAPGEANRLRVSLVAGSHGVVDVRDEGASIAVGDRCTAVSPNEARCDAAADFVDVVVDVKELDDEVTIEPPLYGLVLGGDGNDTLLGGCQLTGGPGDDVLRGCSGINPGLNHTLRGGPGNDTIDGGDAPDIIDGGGGRDTLHGGEGNDSFNDGDAMAGTTDADVIDGGPGDGDFVWYAERTASVRVDLADPTAPQGAMGEGDTLRNLENVASGKGNDTLLGDAGSNRLDGGDGADTIDGREGNDTLFDGAGVDTIDAGPGDDEIVTRDLYADTATCGDGSDRALVDGGDRVAIDCDGISRTPVDLIPGRYRLGMRDGRIVVRLACPDLDELPRTVAREFEDCSFDVILRLPVAGRLIVAGRISCRAIICPGLKVRRSAQRMLLRRRQVTGVVEFVRLPRAGAIRHTERAVVKISRR